MMAQGRGSAGPATGAMVMLLLCLMAHMRHAQAATYTVGGSGGWTFNMSSWLKGKRFSAGDTLVFNYDPTLHNVVVVDSGGYTNCRAPANAKVFKSGKDQIQLAKGQSFFICSFAGHCESGMKIAVTAAS